MTWVLSIPAAQDVWGGPVDAFSLDWADRAGLERKEGLREGKQGIRGADKRDIPGGLALS